MFAHYASDCPRCHNGIPAGTRIVKPLGARYYVHAVCPRFVPAAPVAPVAAPVAASMDADDAAYTAYLNSPLTASDMGAYVATNDVSRVYSVRSAAGDHGAYYFAQRWDSGRFYTKDANGTGWTGRVTRWIRAGKLRKMAQLEAADFVSATGWCPVHAGTLTNKDSVDAGVGPVCAERMGWDRMGMARANRAARAATVVAERAVVLAAQTPAEHAARYAELFGDDDEPAERFTPDGEPVGIASMPAAFTATPEAAAHQARVDGYKNRGFTVSRWSRPSDDSLADAGYAF